jgi:lysophospholipase L1-like esterase
LLFFAGNSSCQKNNLQQTQQMPAPVSVHNDTATDYSKKSFTYLALGDSYTIGQSVPEKENYPNQTITLLKKDGLEGQVRIIATTGWTTEGSLLKTYDVVTLLIGVNNQYRDQEAAIYKPGFEELLKKAIMLADNNVNHVIVISIPDWGVTPFGVGRGSDMITKEINAYNDINKQLSQQYGVNYIDITPLTREAGTDASLLASDELHYSGKEYTLWAEKVAGIIKIVLH